jgi:hypothetical protein
MKVSDRNLKNSTELTNFSLPLGLIHPPGSDEVRAANLALNQVTPFIRFAHLIANQALLEALAGEC